MLKSHIASTCAGHLLAREKAGVDNEGDLTYYEARRIKP